MKAEVVRSLGHGSHGLTAPASCSSGSRWRSLAIAVAARRERLCQDPNTTPGHCLRSPLPLGIILCKLDPEVFDGRHLSMKQLCRPTADHKASSQLSVSRSVCTTGSVHNRRLLPPNACLMHCNAGARLLLHLVRGEPKSHTDDTRRSMMAA